MHKLFLALGLLLPLVSQADPITRCSGDLATTGSDEAALSCSGDLPRQNTVTSSDTIEVNGTTYTLRDTFRDAARAHGVILRQDYALPLNNSLLLGTRDFRDESIDKTPLLALDRSFTIITNPAAVTLGAKLSIGSGSGITVQLPDDFLPIEGTLVVGGSYSLHLVPVGTSVTGSTRFYDGWVVISSVPEPSTYATLLLGLAAVGWVSRKRS